jgi:hypothetical protein
LASETPYVGANTIGKGGSACDPKFIISDSEKIELIALCLADAF